MNIGDYVRTKKGEIHQILDEEIDIIFRADMGVNYPFWRDVGYDNYILKSSPNIIDLIQVGDYVNGILIESIYKFKDGTISLNNEPITHCGIETTVTKEQFESMEYRVGDK